MNRLTALTMIAASTLVAGSVSTHASSPAGGGGDGHRRPITVGAACEGPASVALRLASNDEPHQGPKLTLTLSGARPGSRWQVSFEEYSGDSGSVGGGPVRTDDQGRWQLRSWTSGGKVRLVFEAASRAGQHCEVTWDGAFEPL